MIPRVFHRIWVGGPEPSWLEPFGRSWVEHHPGWELRQWTDDNVSSLFPLTNQRLYDQAETLAPNHVGQLRADVLRYELLWRRGGVYVDADFRCLRPLDGLIDGMDCFATFEEQGRWVANGLMGAVPSHPTIGHLIEGLDTSVGDGGRRPAQMSGPQYLTKVWRRHGGMEVLDQRHFYPYSYRDVDTHPVDEQISDPEVYAVHVWHNRRRERGLL